MSTAVEDIPPDTADQVVRNSSLLLLSTATMAGLGFVFWMIVTRLYTPVQVGLATSLISATNLIAYTSLLGLNSTLVRFRAPRRARNGQLTRCCLLVGAAACAAGSAYLIGLPRYGEKLLFIRQDPLHAATFVFFCVCVALSLLTDAVFIGERMPQYNVITDGLVQGLSKLALPALLLGLGAFGIIAASGAGYLAGTLASFILMYRKLKFRPRLRAKDTHLRDHLGFSLASYGSSLLNLAPLLVLPLIVLQRLGAAQAAFYFAAFQIATLLYAISYSVGEALFAEVSNNESRFVPLLRRSALVMAGAQIPAAVVVVAAVPMLRLFGAEYAAGAGPLLMVLAVASVAVAMNTWASFALKLARRLKHLVVGNVLYATVTIGLAIALAPRGLVWLGWAWTAGNLVAGLYCSLALLGARAPVAPSAAHSRPSRQAGAIARPRRAERPDASTPPPRTALSSEDGALAFDTNKMAARQAHRPGPTGALVTSSVLPNQSCARNGTSLVPRNAPENGWRPE
ncbi:oligosaccharide flippase family protein (plasmid) [Kitasatospora sp. NBC_00070]|uniref:lipopolysaccharide biosynthesis protein n=1 Tax=Kitasatospora sp. NBC_00070 TaxID=2975962 RepID=UPI002F917B92